MLSKIIYNQSKITCFIKVDDVSYLAPFQQGDFLNKKSERLENAYLSEDEKYLIIEKDVIVQKGAALANQYTGKGTRLITKHENATALIRAMSIAWKYKKMYEAGITTDEIIKKEKIASRTIYKYLNLAYLSPKIVNAIMDSDIPTNLNLQRLFEIASKYKTFHEQEKAFC